MDGGEPRKEEGETGVTPRASHWGSLPLSSSTRTAQPPQIPLQQGGACTKDLISSLGTPITENTNTHPVCLCN